MFACENDSPANIEICRLILGGMSTVMRRYRMLIDQDSQGWNSLHFASKSGCLQNYRGTLCWEEKYTLKCTCTIIEKQWKD